MKFSQAVLSLALNTALMFSAEARGDSMSSGRVDPPDPYTTPPPRRAGPTDGEELRGVAHHNRNRKDAYNMKKLTALFLTLALCMGLAIPAAAADQQIITVGDQTYDRVMAPCWPWRRMSPSLWCWAVTSS